MAQKAAPFAKVRAIRVALNIPIGEFCALLFINPGTYSGWKNKGWVPWGMFKRCEALQASMKRRVGLKPPREKRLRRGWNKSGGAEEIMTVDIEEDFII